MIIPSDINYIQLGDAQVWKCDHDEVGFDPKGRWSKVIHTYKFFQGEQMWRLQTVKQAPFCCTLIIFTQSYGQ